MNRIVIITLLVCLLAAMPATASADDSTQEFPGCGTVVNRNTSHQFGLFNWVEYIVETQGVFDICGQWIVQVHASIVGVPNSDLWRAGVFYASAVRQIPVPNYGTWQTRGEHFTSGSIPNPLCCGGMWPTGTTASHATVVPPQEPEPDLEFECMLENGYWDGSRCIPQNCPIIVDTARDGYKLTSTDDGVRFDLNADGSAELVAWTQPDSDDAFLVMDRNGNGRIDDGTELFGNHTPAVPDQYDRTTPNGFEALAFLSSPSYGPGVSDGEVNARDAAYARLLLWRDVNHNGVSESDELTPVNSAGLVAIGTDYRETKRVDRFGNQFRQKGRVTWADGSVEPIYDVWLRWRQQ